MIKGSVVDIIRQKKLGPILKLYLNVDFSNLLPGFGHHCLWSSMHTAKKENN